MSGESNLLRQVAEEESIAATSVQHDVFGRCLGRLSNSIQQGAVTPRS